jgi:glycosyltransferase involved in cell wall biosynthesis
VASATGGTPEAITPDDTGLLFARGSVEELAAALDRLEADRALCRRLGARGRAMACRRFNLGGQVDALLGLENTGRAAA